MAQESAGLIVFRRMSDTIQYLLLQHVSGENHWTPPKGPPKDDEDSIEAAIRSTKEETNLVERSDYKIVDKNFTIEIEYLVKHRLKKVVYRLAELKDPFTLIELCDEHLDFRWCDLEESIGLARFDTMISVLKQSETFLKNNFFS